MATTKITTNSLTDSSVTSAKLANSISIGTLGVTGNLTVDTNTLFVDAANNRVGIGTATPNHSLTIASGNVIGFAPTSVQNITQFIYSDNSDMLNVGTTTSGKGVYLAGNTFTGSTVALGTGRTISFASNSGTWNGATLGGNQTFSGQIQLSASQSVTDGNSVLTSNLLTFARARNAAQTYAPYPPLGSGIVGGSSGVSGNNAFLTLNSALSGSARRLTYCTIIRPTAGWSGLTTNFSIKYLAVGTFAIRDLGTDSVTMRFYLGATTSIALANSPALSAAGICFEISKNSAASGLFQYRLIVHNGTTLSVSSFVNLHSDATLYNRSNSFALQSNGLGNISLWVKSVVDTGHASIPDITTAPNLTTDLGPSGTSGNNVFCVDLATRSNLSAVANTEARVFHYELYTHT